MMVAFTSCVKDVVLDAESKPQIVLECVLGFYDPIMPCATSLSGNTRSLYDDVLYERIGIQTLRLSKTKGASANEAEPVKDAHAVLIDITDSLRIGEFNKQEDGIWTLDHEPVRGHKYRLEVSISGYDMIYAEQTVPSNNIELVHGGKEPGSWWIHVLCLKDNVATLVDELCTDLPADNFNLTGEIYDSYKSYVDYDYAYMHAPYHPKLDGCAMHYRYLRLPDENYDNAHTDMSEHLSFNDIYYKDATYIIVSSRVSEDYDRYMKEALHYNYIYNESADMSSIYIRENMNTNIHGALGIFGAQVLYKKEWWYPKNRN
jgi:hypothetical protein